MAGCTPRAYSRLPHIPGLTCLFAYLLVLELWPEWQASCLTHTGAYGGAFREHGWWTPSLRSPSASFQLAISQKEAYTLVWCLDFCDCCPEDTSRSPRSRWKPARLVLQSHRIVYICIIQMLPPESLPFDQPESRCFVTLTGPGTPSTTWSH